MSKSLISNERECYVCKTRYNLHKHHMIYGTANRKNSEKYGLWCYLCFDHHTGEHGVHNGNKLLDAFLKKTAQMQFEEIYGHDKFMQVFRRNFM